jgi:hypothetical protein
LDNGWWDWKSNSSQWQLVKDTSNTDFDKITLDEQELKNYNNKKSADIPSNIKYKGNWNQYQYYYANDLINYGNYAYLITRDIPSSLYYYHPDQSNLANYIKVIGDISNAESGWRQQYINNAYCSTIDDIIPDSISGWNIGNNVLTKDAYIFKFGKILGITWNNFKQKNKVTIQEESIARASCPKSQISSSYYKKSFDGSIITSNSLFKLNNALILLAGISAIFLVHNILKEK